MDPVSQVLIVGFIIFVFLGITLALAIWALTRSPPQNSIE